MNASGANKWLVVAALGALGLVLLDRVVLTPALEGFGRQSERLAELRESVAKGRQLLERQEALKERWADMQRRALSSDIPAAEDKLLKSVAQWVQASHITLTGLTPQWRRHKQGYQTLECRATAQGNLQAIARFLYELEKDPLALQLEQYELAARDERGYQLTLNARFSGLQLSPPPEARR